MGDRLATIDMGRKEGLLYPFRGAVKLGPHLTQCRVGRGLPPHQVASGIVIDPAVWPQPTWAEQ